MTSLRIENEVTRVTHQRWEQAQKFERNLWVQTTANRPPSFKIATKFVRALKRPSILFLYFRYRDFYIGDDWNYWWMNQFKGYRALPTNVNDALEIGCGPYTNIRLITHRCHPKAIICADPLIKTYLGFQRTWLSTACDRRNVTPLEATGESLPLPDSSQDLVACINVLDHVRDAGKCMAEAARVLRPGAYFVFGQDLTDAKDVAKHSVEDQGHPIWLSEQTIGAWLEGAYNPLLRRILPRSEGRSPDYHCGTYLFIGRRC